MVMQWPANLYERKGIHIPLYEFTCTNEKCKKDFEEKVSLTEFDTKVVECPDCKTKAERKLSIQRTGHTTWKNWRL